MTPAGEKINISFIASRARVSVTTVSNYLNGCDVIPISPATASRIAAVMREFNYRPHGGGSLIRRQATLPEKVCFVYGPNVSLSAFGVIQEPIVARLLREFELFLAERFGFKLEVRSIRRNGGRAEWNELLLDVALVLNFDTLNFDLCDLAYRKNIPVVELAVDDAVRLLGTDWPGGFGADLLIRDCAAQSAAMTAYLAEKGARRLGFLSSWNVRANLGGFGGHDGEARIAGFRRAVAADSRLRGEVFTPPFPPCRDAHYESRSAFEFLRQQPQRWKELDGFVCHNDAVAAGVIAAAHAAGRQVGRDLLVGGAGDLPDCRYLTPAITTCDFDPAFQLQALAELIDNRRAAPASPVRRIEVPTVIIPRETAR